MPPKAVLERGRAADPHPAPAEFPLRVHYITMEFPSPSETFATNDIRALQERGVELAVHALRPAREGLATLAAERGVERVPVTTTSPTGMLRGLIRTVVRPHLAWTLVTGILRHCRSRPEHVLKSILLLPRAIEIFLDVRRARPHVVHLYWGHYPSMIGYLVQRHLPDTPVTISLGAYDLEERYGLSGPVARRAQMVRTLGQVNVPDVEQTFNVPRDRITVIPDGVDLDMFPSADGVRKVRRRIATAGRLIASKGMDDALDVFADVAGRFPDATLDVLGDGPERSRLQAKAVELGVANAVRFLGHVPHEDVVAHMAAAEVFLFMSTKTSERLPNVVKEAMGCRCLCVATHTPGIHELVDHGETGWIVPLRGVEAASGHIRDMFAPGAETRIPAMTERAYRHLVDEFSLQTSIDTYVEEWRALAGVGPTAERSRLVDGP